MRALLTHIFASLPATLRALNDNPLAAIVLVVLGAFGMVAYIVHALR